MRLLLRILSLLFIFFLLRYLVRSIFVSANPKKNASDESTASETVSPRVLQGRMEKDPVCGTYVDVASSPNLSWGKETRYFCSEECREKFQGKLGK